MSKQTNSLSRRNFLKGAAYTSALSIGGLSSVAIAAVEDSKTGLISEVTSSSVTLFNQSDEVVTLHGANPVSLEKVNDWVMLNINKTAPESPDNISTEEVFTIAAGQKMSFSITSELAPMLTKTNSHVVITNQYSSLNNFVPMTPMMANDNGMMA